MLSNATIPGIDGAAVSSLDTTSETVGEAYRECPRRESRLLVDYNDPSRWIKTGCDAYVCPFCGPHKARSFARGASWVLTEQKRSRFVTLTNAPGEWQARRQKVRDLTRRIKSEGLHSEIAWTTEIGSKTGMVHVHALQWGDYLPQQELQEWWGSIVDVRAVKVTHKAVGEYVTKSAHGVGQYISKGAAAEYDTWRDLNGGRPLHSSRGFFMGLGVRGAVKAANAAGRKGDAPKWGVPTPEMVKVRAAFLATGDTDHMEHLRNLCLPPELRTEIPNGLFDLRDARRVEFKMHLINSARVISTPTKGAAS